MAKPPSKLDQQRAMREARFTPAKKPTERHESAQPLKLDPPEATEVQIFEEDADTDAFKRPTKSQERRLAAGRKGKVQLSVWIDANLDREMRIAMAEQGVKKLEDWVSHAIADRLGRA